MCIRDSFKGVALSYDFARDSSIYWFLKYAQELFGEGSASPNALMSTAPSASSLSDSMTNSSKSAGQIETSSSDLIPTCGAAYKLETRCEQ